MMSRNWFVRVAFVFLLQLLALRSETLLRLHRLEKLTPLF
ncbi:hypothetical protein BS78_09G253100 [Paspalum vaginatum]|nr:hypothetical protein BS78_09G253100 [Paspalum vaginatum]